MSAQWQQVEEIFHAAAAIDPVKREEFLLQACGGDTGLLNDVRSLLDCESQAEGFFEQAIGEVAASISDQPNEDRRIGPYRIIRRLGQGGMGAVYLAIRDDDHYSKQVALKLVRQGMDTPWLLERFRYERQILATLEHPHIARMLDGGATNEGLPYIVMEYVEGQPISTYVLTNALDVSARLRLFRDVCRAVEYAHRKLVIHRDLKPANILVATDGTPRLLDFGTAKLLNPEFEDAQRTQTGAQMLTPDYASPEQLRGEPVTTASDVYSLGIILYELLTGRRPFDTGGRASIALEHAITGTEILPPSVSAAREPKLRKTLAGDLDNIVMMAIRKEPERRYGSVEQFSEDLRRYLDGLPIRARADTVSYRTRKFLQRNRVGVGAAAAAMIAVLSGAGVAVWQAHEAGIAADRAQRRFDEVRALSNTFLFDVQDKLQNVPGTLAVRKTLVDTALKHLDKLATEADDDPGLQYELASAYDRVGRIQGNPAESNLGDTKEALINLQKAVVLFDKAIGAQPSNETWLIGASAGYRRYAEALNPTSSQQALEAVARSIDIGRRAVAIGKSSHRFETLRAALSRQGDYRRITGNNTGALESAQESLRLAQQLQQSTLGPEAERSLALSYSAIGIAKRRLGDYVGAAEAFRTSVATREAILKSGNANSLDGRSLGLVYLELAKLEFQLHSDDFRYAAREAERSLQTLQAVDRDTEDTRAISDEASAHMVLGSALRSIDPRKASLNFLEALKARKRLGNSALNLSNLASTFNELASLEFTAKNYQLARDYLDQALSASQQSLQAEPQRISSLATMASIQLLLSNLHIARQQMQEAERWSRAAIETGKRLNRADDPQERTWLADAYTSAGKIRQAQGDQAGAAEYFRQSLAIWEKPPVSPQEHKRRNEAASLVAATQGR
jgi:tetratricopeptide (TPR) repeat protein